MHISLILDFEVDVKTVQIMAKLGEQSWKVAPSNSSNIDNVHTVKLEGGNSLYRYYNNIFHKNISDKQAKINLLNCHYYFSSLFNNSIILLDD